MPYVPSRSGVPIPLSSRLAVPEGGKLAGMRITVVGMLFSSSTSQNGVPWRNNSTVPPDNGSCQRPSLIVLLGSDDREVDKYGTMVMVSRCMKS